MRPQQARNASCLQRDTQRAVWQCRAELQAEAAINAFSLKY
jgi:hypothetical protein